MMIIDKIKNIFDQRDDNLYCYTDNSAIFQFGEIELSKKCLPSWWKELPSTTHQGYHHFQQPSATKIFSSFKNMISTAKHCPAIQGLFSSGIIIKAWCDIKIFVSPEGLVGSIQREDKLSATKLSGTTHPYAQRAGFLPNMAHWKISSPWYFNSKKYRKFFWNGAYWWNPYLIENNIHVVPGFIDYYTQAGTEINLMLPIKKESYEINIKLGDPLIHLFPIDNNPIKINRKLIPTEELMKFQNPHVKFIGSAHQLKSTRLKK